MPILHVPFEIKEIQDATHTIIGYGSVFGNIDDGGDVVQQGAFKESLADLTRRGQPIKMMYRHKEPIGVWHKYGEDAKGLLLEGSPLVNDVQRAKEAYALARVGALNGLSIGYRTRDSAPGAKGTRILKRLDVKEVSLAVFPMNDQASILAVKECATPRELEDALRELGFTRRDAKALVAGGFKELNRQRDADPGQGDQRDAGESAGLREALEILQRTVRGR